MKRVYLLAASVLASIFFGVAAADTKTDPRESLDTAIPEAIRLLEAREYAAFLKSFLPPHELKKFTEKNSLEELAKGFGEKKASRLLRVLKAIKDLKPTFDAEGKEATYEMKERIDGKKSIFFARIDKYLYIQN